MRYLIKNAKIVAPGSKHNNKRLDILISNGIIKKISKSISDEKSKLIESENLHVSIGWFDIGTHLGEPGHEHRETIKSLCSAALAGGYTDLAPMPTAQPVIQTRAQITSLQTDSKSYGVDIHPVGALSCDNSGENIAEYVDMRSVGVTTYSDGLNSVQKNGLLLRALQYAKGINGLILHHPSDISLNNGNQIHEGGISIKMGIKGSPELAEHLMVERDIQMAKYSESKICIHCISSKGSVDRIKKAKENNRNIFASVAYMNLVSTDKNLENFNSNFKVIPVLRAESDRKALIKAIKNGTLDFICSNHTPLEEEAKKLEFPYAECGATGLETMYAVLNNTIGNNLTPTELVNLVAINPRRVINIDIPRIEEDEKAKLTCWDPTTEWRYTTENRKSKSDNNPYIDDLLIGKVKATINGTISYIA